MMMTQQLPAEFGHRTVGDYLVALASGAPTPGGGSAAGLAGALGCSLGAMVCNLTRLKQDSAELTALANSFVLMADRLLSLAERDEHAFGSYRSATSLPRSTDDEKAARRAAVEQALVQAAEVPLAMIEVGAAALGCLRRTAEIGTPHALGDVMTGGFLLQATALGALENVEANAASMKAPELRQRFEDAARVARQELDAAMAALNKAVDARTSGDA